MAVISPTYLGANDRSSASRAVLEEKTPADPRDDEDRQQVDHSRR
jgi:hypothetical protein